MLLVGRVFAMQLLGCLGWLLGGCLLAKRVSPQVSGLCGWCLSFNVHLWGFSALLSSTSKITAHLFNETHDWDYHWLRVICWSLMLKVKGSFESLTVWVTVTVSGHIFVVLFSDQVTSPVICSPLMTTRPLTAGLSLDCHTDPVRRRGPAGGRGPGEPRVQPTRPLTHLRGSAGGLAHVRQEGAGRGGRAVQCLL